MQKYLTVKRWGWLLHFTLLHLDYLYIYLWTKFIDSVEYVLSQKTIFLSFVVNDAYIEKDIMIDTVHAHGCLIFLFGFNFHFVSNLTCLYSYNLITYYLMVSLACIFYVSRALILCLGNNLASIFSLQKLCRSPSVRQHCLLSKNTLYIEFIHWSLHQIRWKLAEDPFRLSKMLLIPCNSN